MSRLVAIACLAFATCVTATLTPSTVLNINSGDVQGIFNSKSNITWFKGIPYAAPPIGDLRFAPTKPEAPWTGVLNASEYGPGCISYCPPVGFPKRELMCAAKQSEDCLYLNVFTPALSSSSEPTPVVVFIHGGNFEYGAGGVPLYDGQQLAMTQNVVVVTINYRLNVFGALYTGAGKIEGNFMLMDQIRALEWVQNNIAYFGGDPDRVTISGQSAGAFSTASLVTMPAAAGLFDKAIIISNPFTLLAADPAGAMQLGMKVSDALGCGSSGSVEEIKCLRSVTAEQILNVSKTNYNFNPNALLNVMMQWVPVVDGDLLPMQPLDAYERGAFTKVPIFFGTVANESVEFIWELSPAPLSVDGLALLAGTIFGPNLTQVIDLYGWPPKSQDADTRDFLSVIATDFIFYCVNRYVGRAMSKHTLTFMWYFDYASYLNPWIFNKTMPECVTNVCHAQDLEFIFFPIDWIAPEKGEPLPVPDSERRLAKLVQDSWGHFIHTGSPDPVGAGRGPDVVSPGTQYPQFNGTQNLLVNISLPTSMLHGYRNDYCDFWDKLGYRKRR